MKISVSTTLDVDIDTAWEMLHTPSVFTAVSGPFTTIRPTGEPLPERFEPGKQYGVAVSALSIIPLGRQVIQLEDEEPSWSVRHTTDVGHGVSGPLGLLRHWRHRMSLRANPDGTTLFSDQLTAQAGWLTPVVWPALAVFWQWRALRLRRLAKARVPEGTALWNRRYGTTAQMWSGKVNPVVEQVASTLTPGTALDLGSGEGGDAIWLAEHGWRVHAVDASSVAIFRGEAEAKSRGLPITWQVADLATGRLPETTYELVSLQFLHIDPATRETVWQEAASRVAPGGTLLIVGHGVKDLEAGIPRPPKELLFDTDSFDTLHPENWSEWSVTERQRTITRDGHEHTIWDVVLVAKR